MIFGTKAWQLSRTERQAMVERVNPALPISQQCRLLALPRSSVYRKPTEVSAGNSPRPAAMFRLASMTYVHSK